MFGVVQVLIALISTLLCVHFFNSGKVTELLPVCESAANSAYYLLFRFFFFFFFFFFVMI